MNDVWDLWIFLAAFLAGATLFILKRKVKNPPYPPGPSRLPIIGNLRDLPSQQEWVTYANWSRKYGTGLSVQ